LPVPVFLNRFAAPRCVFILGMEIPSKALLQTVLRENEFPATWTAR
jgi:hypothetical protein